LVDALGKAERAETQGTILRGLREGLKGRRRVKMPAGWPKAFARLAKSPDADVRGLAVALAVTFGDPGGLAQMRKVKRARDADARLGRRALAPLAEASAPALALVLHARGAAPARRGGAIGALGGHHPRKPPAATRAAYGGLGPAEKRDALNTLASRAAY